MPTVNIACAAIWPQPLAPVHSLGISAAFAAVPLLVLLLLMGVLRKSGLFASACGLATAAVLAVAVWHMPVPLAAWSMAYGAAFAAWAILWLVFNALWLYQLAVETGSFDLLRQWTRQHATDDPCAQAILVAFCFGALLEGTAGFGAPVAITAFLLVGLGFAPKKAVVLSLIANTAPVAFGAIGIPIVALAGVTGLDTMKLSAAVGRQLPLLSFVLPFYLALVIDGTKGLRRSWPVALVAGGSFAATQFLVSNLWGPYATDILSSLISLFATVGFMSMRRSSGVTDRNAADSTEATGGEPARRLSGWKVAGAWFPWAALSLLMILWSYARVSPIGQIVIHVPRLDNGVLISLYQKPFAAVFSFQPLASGTGVLTAVLFVALCLRVRPSVLVSTGKKAAKQLLLPGVTVLLIVCLAYLYNYSGMAYTLGAALAEVGAIFPLVSSFLGWIACFLSGSDTASNVLFGNLQVAAAHQLHLNPVLLAATNSSGAVAGKMISPQNIAVGVTTVGMTGEEGKVLHGTFWHSVLFALLIGTLALLQAYAAPWMIP